MRHWRPLAGAQPEIGIRLEVADVSGAPIPDAVVAVKVPGNDVTKVFATKPNGVVVIPLDWVVGLEIQIKTRGIQAWTYRPEAAAAGRLSITMQIREDLELSGYPITIAPDPRGIQLTTIGGSGRPIEGVELVFFDESIKRIQTIRTDANGEVWLKEEPDKSIRVGFQKAGIRRSPLRTS